MAIPDKRFKPLSIDEQLRNCSTVQECFHCLDKNYDLTFKLTSLDKALLIPGLKKLIKQYKVKEK